MRSSLEVATTLIPNNPALRDQVALAIDARDSQWVAKAHFTFEPLAVEESSADPVVDAPQ